MREGGSASKTLGWGIVIGGVLIVAAVVALYSPSMCLFDLRDLSIESGAHLTEGEIGRLAAVRHGENLLRISLGGVRERVGSNPWARSVEVARRLPHTLEIRVVERLPLASVKIPEDGEWTVLAEDGVAVARASRPPADLLIAQGLSWTGDSSSIAPSELEILTDLRQEEVRPPTFAVVDFTDPTNVTLRGEDGPTVSLGPLAQAARSVIELGALLDSIPVNDYQTIDLTYEGEAILVPR
ncbi:MAG: FtsQ-type POTRA domain-containing protein [Candidatus Bipolaricaulota bacterium]|nr:MAG: FtsQ-type POTRA domain-containing protein [Candidatus Bipolaricaulota bacterium]